MLNCMTFDNSDTVDNQSDEHANRHSDHTTILGYQFPIIPFNGTFTTFFTSGEFSSTPVTISSINSKRKFVDRPQRQPSARALVNHHVLSGAPQFPQNSRTSSHASAALHAKREKLRAKLYDRRQQRLAVSNNLIADSAATCKSLSKDFETKLYLDVDIDSLVHSIEGLNHHSLNELPTSERSETKCRKPIKSKPNFLGPRKIEAHSYVKHKMLLNGHKSPLHNGTSEEDKNRLELSTNVTSNYRIVTDHSSSNESESAGGDSVLAADDVDVDIASRSSVSSVCTSTTGLCVSDSATNNDLAASGQEVGDVSTSSLMGPSPHDDSLPLSGYSTSSSMISTSTVHYEDSSNSSGAGQDYDLTTSMMTEAFVCGHNDEFSATLALVSEGQKCFTTVKTKRNKKPNFKENTPYSIDLNRHHTSFPDDSSIVASSSRSSVQKTSHDGSCTSKLAEKSINNCILDSSLAPFRQRSDSSQHLSNGLMSHRFNPRFSQGRSANSATLADYFPSKIDASVDCTSVKCLNESVVKVPYNKDVDFPVVIASLPALSNAATTTSALSILQSKISYAKVVLSDKLVKLNESTVSKPSHSNQFPSNYSQPSESLTKIEIHDQQSTLNRSAELLPAIIEPPLDDSLSLTNNIEPCTSSPLVDKDGPISISATAVATESFNEPSTSASVFTTDGVLVHPAVEFMDVQKSGQFFDNRCSTAANFTFTFGDFDELEPTCLDRHVKEPEKICFSDLELIVNETKPLVQSFTVPSSALCNDISVSPPRCVPSETEKKMMKFVADEWKKFVTGKNVFYYKSD